MAHEVAKMLHLPLDIIIVRKLGVISNPEFAFGAIAEGDITIVDNAVIQMSSMDREQIESIIQKEKNELTRRKELYKSGSYHKNIHYDQVILIDDGLATGMTMEAAIRATRALYHPQEIIVAVPVAATDSVRNILPKVDQFITLYQSEYFGSVGQYYLSFDQTNDTEVLDLLNTQKNSLGVYDQ